MDYPLFFKAVLIGLSVAAPVGPIGLLCIQRSLTHGARIGFISGLGAAAADGLYGAIGAFGLVAITQFFVMLATPLAIGGAFFLSWMGWQLLRAQPAAQAAQTASAPHAGKAFLSVFLLTLANPMTILSFLAVFAAISGAGGVAGAASTRAGSTGIMLLGILSGSALWWLSLASSVALLRHKISTSVMRRINQVAGLFLLCFAAWQLLSLWRA